VKYKIFFLILITLLLCSCQTVNNNVPKSAAVSGEDYYSGAVAALGVDNYEEAKALFLKALKMHYKETGCYYYLGLIEYQQGNLDKSEYYLKNCISLNNNVTDAHNTLGAIYAKKRDYKKAIKEFKTVLLDKTYLYPENALYNLALIHYALKNYDKSIYYCNESLKYVPKSPAVIYLIGLNLYKKGLKKETVKVMENIIKNY
jgi:tetratricopeptide (TPR) repeat protein